MSGLLVRSTIFSAVLCQIIVIFGATFAAITVISNKELVEKILVDTVSITGATSETSSMELDIPVPAGTEEAAGTSSTQLDVSTTLCEAEEKLKLGFCQIFLENEISFDFNFEEGTGNLVCGPRKIVLTKLDQSSLDNNDHMHTYQCPRIVESVLLPEIFTYHVSQARTDSPVVVYTQRNSFSQIHPFKAVSHVDLAELAVINVRYYNKPENVLEPMDDLSWSGNADELIEKANESKRMKQMTHAYAKFVQFYGSFSACSMTANEKLFACKYNVFPRTNPVANTEIDAHVDTYNVSSAYNGSRCRRYPTVAVKDAKTAELDLGGGLAQFRCPAMAWYDLEQGTSALSPKIYFDHTVRLVSSNFASSSAFLSDSRYHQVALAAIVSGIDNKNLAKLRSLRKLSRRRTKDDEIEGSYTPARKPEEYVTMAPLIMSRAAAEEAIGILKGLASKDTHDKFVHGYSKVSLADYKTAPERIKLCNEVFGHQMFGYTIEEARLERNRPFEFYIDRLDHRVDERNKKLIGFSCTPSKQTTSIYAELLVVGGFEKGGIVVLVRDNSSSNLLTPLAVSYPKSLSTRA